MKFFEIDFLEAGTRDSGDAIALRYRTDSGLDWVHVVDGGYTDDGDKLVDHINEYYNKPRLIDHVVLTHPDGDHAAGLKAVLEKFSVGTLWMNRPWMHLSTLAGRFNYNYTEEGLRRRLRKDYPYVAALEDIAKERQVEIRSALRGDKIGAFYVLAPSLNRYIDLVVDSDKTPEAQRKAAIVGRAYDRVIKLVNMVRALWGEENLKGDSQGTSRENEMSVVQFAELCEKKILLTGDAGVEALSEAYEYARLCEVPLPGIDRFDVPHHGSRRNLSSDVLDKWLGPILAERPDETTFTAIVSANQKDKEHPRKSVVRALIHRGARVITTEGTIRTGRHAPDRAGWGPIDPQEYPYEMEE